MGLRNNAEDFCVIVPESKCYFSAEPLRRISLDLNSVLKIYTCKFWVTKEGNMV